MNPGDAHRRRFIAGAICPQCKALDRTVIYRDAGRDFRACVSCGFNEELNFSTPAIQEPVQVLKLPD